MKCSACGFENRPGVKFCEQCGSAMQAPAPRQQTGVICPNCGQANATTASFCMRCGFRLAPVPLASRPEQTVWQAVAKAAGWLAVGYIVTFLALNIWGILQTLSPIMGTKTAEAEALAIDFVREYYPQLADAERTVYAANIEGTDYYVVDFVVNDPARPPMGVRILVDRLLRAVFAYEAIGT
ncbi:MAG: zinc ribbon domain-containing protein [Chloroflexi bacterium]|nr:zinc ribbon domain-containing protein [Chloroflexota bacterium]